MIYKINELSDQLLDIALALSLGLVFEIKLGKVFVESSGWFIPTQDGNIILKLMKEQKIVLGAFIGLYGCNSVNASKMTTGYTQHQAVIKMYLLIKNNNKDEVDIPQWCLDEIEKYNNRLELDCSNFGSTFEKLKSRV